MLIVYFMLGLVFAGVVFESAERTAKALKKRRERKRLEDPERVRLEEENKMLKLQLGLPPERRIALEPEPYGQAQSRGYRFAQRTDEEQARRDRKAAEDELSKSLAGLAGTVPIIAALAALTILTKKTKRSAQREFTKRETVEAYARLRARSRSGNEDESCQDPTSEDLN